METTLGKRIGLLRRQKELKQDELAEMLGVSPQAVSKWENDQTCPDISLLPQLARILGVSVDELLTGESAQTKDVMIAPVEERKDPKDMTLRVIVNSHRGDKVRINLPVELLEAALDIGLELPQLAGNPSLQSIDFTKIMDLIRRGVIGTLVEVESADGDTVLIKVE